MTVLTDSVSFEEASTLPVAGLTALYALEEGGNLLGRSVLVTGASGGAALQLARAAGAWVVGLVRREEHAGFVEEVVVDESGAAPGDLTTWLSNQSAVLGNALSMLAPGGTCVSFGTSASAEVEFDARSLYLTGGAKLYGFISFQEVLARPASDGLDRLARMEG